MSPHGLKMFFLLLDSSRESMKGGFLLLSSIWAFAAGSWGAALAPGPAGGEVSARGDAALPNQTQDRYTEKVGLM